MHLVDKVWFLQEQRRSSSSGNAQEQGSWRSRPHFTGPEYSWGYFDGAGKIMNALISLGYISLCYLLGFFYFLTGERPYQMLAVRFPRHDRIVCNIFRVLQIRVVQIM